MTNHTEINKTNYFRVTDEEKYKKLFDMLTAEDTIHNLTKSSSTNRGAGLSYQNTSANLQTLILKQKDLPKNFLTTRKN